MILNLTALPSTPQQTNAGVMDLSGNELAYLLDLLAVTDASDPQEIDDRAHDIAMLMLANNLGNDDEDDPVPSQVLLSDPDTESGNQKLLTLAICRYVRGEHYVDVCHWRENKLVMPDPIQEEFCDA